MKCIICRKETKSDEDICYTCKAFVKQNKKNPSKLIEYFRSKNGKKE